MKQVTQLFEDVDETNNTNKNAFNSDNIIHATTPSNNKTPLSNTTTNNKNNNDKNNPYLIPNNNKHHYATTTSSAVSNKNKLLHFTPPNYHSTNSNNPSHICLSTTKNTIKLISSTKNPLKHQQSSYSLSSFTSSTSYSSSSTLLSHSSSSSISTQQPIKPTQTPTPDPDAINNLQSQPLNPAGTKLLPRTHLHGNIDDDNTWLHLWWSIFSYPYPLYLPPSCAIGNRFIDIYTS